MTDSNDKHGNPDLSRIPPIDQQIDQQKQLSARIRQQSAATQQETGQIKGQERNPVKSTPETKGPDSASMDATRPRDKNKTEQTVGTDPEFYEILNARFGFSWDLACTRENQLCPMGLTPSENSLSADWHKLEGWLYLNPPFKDSGKWAQKCSDEMEKGARIVMLTPAAVGSNWVRDWVYKRASVRILNGRLKFVGHDTPYPKDCMISIFQKNVYRGIDIWNWREGWE